MVVVVGVRLARLVITGMGEVTAKLLYRELPVVRQIRFQLLSFGSISKSEI